MAIDLLFIIMTAYGFYFGYVHGLIRVVIFILSLTLAFAVAMYVTPSTASLIQQTLELESALLPFVAFVVTLVGIMLVARIVFKLIEENVNSKKANQVTQGVGGVLMATVFIFLFSVLVTFFSEAHVLKPESVRKSSFFFGFVEKIPEYGAKGLAKIVPFMDDFSKYMKESFNKLEDGEETPKKKNSYDDFFSEDDLIIQDSTAKPEETDSTAMPEDQDSSAIAPPLDTTSQEQLPEKNTN